MIVSLECGVPMGCYRVPALLLPVQSTVLSQHIVDTRSHDIGDTMSHDFVDTGSVVVAGENDEFSDTPDPSSHHQLRPDAAERAVRHRVLPRPQNLT